MSILRAALTLLLVGALAGCGSWQKNPKGARKILASARMSQDAVVLELVSIHLPLQHRSLDEVLWREVDEQLLSHAVRVRLAENGIRCGVLGGAFPAALSEVLKGRKPSEKLQQLDDRNQISVHAKRIQNRSGVVHRYLLSDTVNEELHAFTLTNGRLQGRTYPKAQCLLGMQTYPQLDGTIKLLIVPEIEHGESRQRWVGEEGSFRYAARRDNQRFDKLRIETILRPGQTLVLTNQIDQAGLGKQLFVESDNGGGKRKIVLIRLAQTQLDELFTPPRTKSMP